MNFFVLEVEVFSPRWAWYEVPAGANYGDWPRCPVCQRPIGARSWLPPHQVLLRNAERVGDFVDGSAGADLLVSERFLAAYDAEGLTGMEAIFPIEILQHPASHPSDPSHSPVLFGVRFKHTMTRVVKEEMGIEWLMEPQPDYCRTCGPDGGGKGGSSVGYERVVVDASSWTGEDLFYAINQPGVILLSERAREFFERHSFTSARVVECERAAWSFFDLRIERVTYENGSCT